MKKYTETKSSSAAVEGAIVGGLSTFIFSILCPPAALLGVFIGIKHASDRRKAIASEIDEAAEEKMDEVARTFARNRQTGENNIDITVARNSDGILFFTNDSRTYSYQFDDEEGEHSVPLLRSPSRPADYFHQHLGKMNDLGIYEKAIKVSKLWSDNDE